MIMSISASNGSIGNKSRGQNKSKTNMSKGLKQIYAPDLYAMPDYEKIYIIKKKKRLTILFTKIVTKKRKMTCGNWYWTSLSSIKGN